MAATTVILSSMVLAGAGQLFFLVEGWLNVSRQKRKREMCRCACLPFGLHSLPFWSVDFVLGRVRCSTNPRPSWKSGGGGARRKGRQSGTTQRDGRFVSDPSPSSFHPPADKTFTDAWLLFLDLLLQIHRQPPSRSSSSSLPLSHPPFLPSRPILKSSIPPLSARQTLEFTPRIQSTSAGKHVRFARGTKRL